VVPPPVPDRGVGFPPLVVERERGGYPSEHKRGPHHPLSGQVPSPSSILAGDQKMCLSDGSPREVLLLLMREWGGGTLSCREGVGACPGPERGGGVPLSCCGAGQGWVPLRA
jgi:hypothetical protein